MQNISDNFEFTKVTSNRIRNLSGFQSSHKEPKEFNRATFRFVQNISLNEVKKTCDSLYHSIKSTYQLKRKDISILENEYRLSILTRDFEVLVFIEQSEDEPSYYNEFIKVVNISKTEVIFSEEFNLVFSSFFHKFNIILSQIVDIEEFIDTIEELDNTDIRLSYSASLENVIVNISNIEGSIIVYPNFILVEFNVEQPPRKFLSVFLNIHQYLVNTQVDKSLVLLESE